MKMITNTAGMPVGQPDPFLIRAEDGRFYMYTTGAEGVYAYRADTLMGEYEPLGVVFSVEGRQQYWAPSVIYTNGLYYMYVSFETPEESDGHEHIQTMHVAESETPDGPFVRPTRLLPPFSIDSHVVENGDGLFIFYATNDYEAERPGTYIAVDRLKSPREAEGRPIAVLTPSIDEEIFMRDRFKEGEHWHTLEGPFYFRRGNTHFLIYSGNCFQNEHYFLGYAVAESEEDDLTRIKFRKYPAPDVYAPLLHGDSEEEGTGHNSVIEHEGVLYAIYHARDRKTAGTQEGDCRKTAGTHEGDCRTARICRLDLEGERLTAVRL